MKNLILFIAILLAVHASLFLSSAMTMVDGEKHVVNLPFKKRKVVMENAADVTIAQSIDEGSSNVGSGDNFPSDGEGSPIDDENPHSKSIDEGSSNAGSGDNFPSGGEGSTIDDEKPYSKSIDEGSSVGMELKSVLNEVRAEMKTSKMNAVSVREEMVDLVSDFIKPNTLRRLLKEESVPTIENQKKYANQLQLWLTNTKISGGKAILNSVLENVREEQRAFRLRSGRNLVPQTIVKEMKEDGSKVMERNTLMRLLDNTAKPSYKNQQIYASQLQLWLNTRNPGTGSTGN